MTLRKVESELIDGSRVVGGDVDYVNIEGARKDCFAHPILDKYQVCLLKWHSDHLLVQPFLYVDHI